MSRTRLIMCWTVDVAFALTFSTLPVDGVSLWQRGRSGTKANILGEEYHWLRRFIQKWHAVLDSHQSSTPRFPPAEFPLPILPRTGLRQLSHQRLPATARTGQHPPGTSWL